VEEERKIIKIGFDLDGVIVGKPPLVPKGLIEFLTKKPANSSLHFRFPKSLFEQYVRKFSHFYLFRPPLQQNINFIKKLNSKKHELYVISGRYSFLTVETDRWLKKRGLGNFFKAVFINLGNEQPHLFKERIIKELNLDYFFEDDEEVVNYLKSKGVSAFLIKKDGDLGDYFSKIISQDKPSGGVLFLLTFYYPHWTGLTVYAQRIACFMAKRGYQVYVLTSQHDPLLEKKAVFQGVKIRRVAPLLKLSRSVLTPGIIWQMIKEKDRYQVISIHLPFAEVLSATIIGKLLGKKVYLTHNGDLVLPKGLFNRLLEKTYYWLTYWSAKASDGIIAQTEDYARSSPLLSRLGKKLIFIKAPVEIPAPDEAIIKEIKKKNHLGGKKLVGFAGRFVEEKGFDYLLKAIPDVLEKFPGTVFVFAGKTDIEYENFYQQCLPLIKKYKENLCFLGLIKSKRRLASFYKMLDVFVISSRSDCFPSAQIEAALSGTPVVCTDIPGARQLVGETGFGVLVKVGSSRSLATGIIKVLENPQKYLARYPLVKKKFSSQESFSSYEKLFFGN
jgi:glycosyltransferase involved in cell wall biosynthesis/uncharacterized HAD superfamily protein